VYVDQARRDDTRRRKLDDGEDMKLIQTVRGVGFVLRAEAAAA